MPNKQNHNTVKVEIPVEGEYILIINDNILIAKCIYNDLYQYSEFIKFADNYIMTSVNCKVGSVTRGLEEFCKSHNCPKRILHEEISKAIKNPNTINFDTYNEIKNQNIAISKENNILKDDIVKYKETISILEETVGIYNDLILGYSDVISDVETRFNIAYNKLNEFKILLNEHTETLLGKRDNEILSETSFINKSEVASVYNLTKSGNRTYKRKNFSSRYISGNDAKEILKLWKTMQAKDIAKLYPMYTTNQILNYCSKHSDIVKRGVSKEIIAKLKSYNGEKTLKELRQIYNDPNLKRLCKNHNIPYKEA